MDIDEIIEFVVDNGGEDYKKFPADEFIDAVKKHEEYGTIMVVRDKKGILGLARWNWINDDTVEILDAITRKGSRSRILIKYMVKLGFDNNPKAKNMIYQRLYKYPNRDYKYVKVGG